MKISTCIGLIVCTLAIGVTASMAWSSETAAPMEQQKGTIEQQAVVTKVESDTVTLQSLTDDKKIIVISRKDAGSLQTGDRVVLDGENVKKVAPTAEPTLKPNPAGDSSKSPAATPPPSGSSENENVPQMK